jgi:3-deoxy-D-manno-octulosonic-acid transferase
LLEKYGISHFRISGDTRFDRVHAIAGQAPDLPIIAAFTGHHPALVAGSTWPPDEELLCRYINTSGNAWRYILVPHETESSHIRKLTRLLTKKTLLYTELTEGADLDADVLIIDTVGLLSSVYRYGRIAYIGGGFGKGIHNTLEPAAFGLPVIFGPRFDKFREAKELVQAGAGHPVYDFKSLNSILDRFSTDNTMLTTSGKASESYINSKIGATRDIVNSTLKTIPK